MKYFINNNKKKNSRLSLQIARGRRGRNRVAVWVITTYAISAYHHSRGEFEPRSDEVYSMQHYVKKFVSDLRQVDGFLRVLHQ